MKAYVIVILSLFIVACIFSAIVRNNNDEGESFLVNTLFSILSIIALVFTCVGWV